MSRPRNLPEPFDSGTFTVRTAKGAKVPMSSVRTLPNPYRGVRCHDAPTTITERFAALQLVLSDAALSHCSAASVQRLPIPASCEHEDLHVMTVAARLRRPGTIGHRGLDRRETVLVRRVPVTTPAQTWLDLAPVVPLDDLVVIGDEVARRLGSTQLLRTLAQRRVPGAARAREALEWIRIGSVSPMESRSRVLFGRAGLPEPELNVEIHDPDGGWLATGDLVWREAKVVGEYQGRHHFGDYRRGDKDVVRRRALEAIGWTYIDFTKDDYFRRPRRLGLVRRLAAALGCEPDPARMAAIGDSPSLPGGPLRSCGVTT